jgi:hypothetical protein
LRLTRSHNNCPALFHASVNPCKVDYRSTIVAEIYLDSQSCQLSLCLSGGGHIAKKVMEETSGGQS